MSLPVQDHWGPISTVTYMEPTKPWGDGTEGSTKAECWGSKWGIKSCERECLNRGGERILGNPTQG